jgi:hypothetical protein
MRNTRNEIRSTAHPTCCFFVTALIQSGVNMKVAQTLAGHHSAAFTLDQYADAVPPAARGGRREGGQRAARREW